MATKKQTKKATPKTGYSKWAAKHVKKAAKSREPKLRVTNPNFEKNKEKLNHRDCLDRCCEATEPALSDYERGFRDALEKRHADSLEADMNHLQALQSGLEDQKQGYNSSRAAMLHNQSRMLEFESSIVQIEENIKRIQKRVMDRVGNAMSPIQ